MLAARRLPAAFVVALLLLLALVADRVAALRAERALAERVQAAGQLSRRPVVDVTGFPFLDQAIRGRYDRVDVHLRGLQRGEMRVARVDARLSGVRLPLRAVLGRRAPEVPVSSARAQALLTYSDLSGAVGDVLTVTAHGDRLRITGPVRVLVRDVPASALVTVRADDGLVRLDVGEVRIAGQRVPESVASGIARQVPSALDPRLPFGLRLTAVRVTPRGVVATATGRALVLRPT